MVLIDHIDDDTVELRVLKGDEAYDPVTGRLYERATLPLKDLEAEVARATKAYKAAAKAAAKAAEED
jgi:hypothetical protein